MSNPETRSRRLVHLTENHDRIAQDSAFFHFTVKLLAFAAAFTDAVEDAHTFMVADGIMNHFRNEHCLADTRATEKASLSRPSQRRQNINGFYSGFKNFLTLSIDHEEESVPCAMVQAYFLRFQHSLSYRLSVRKH